MADPAQQLQTELMGSVARAIATRRPVLTHLNADATWLVQLPWPSSQTPPPGRSYFNVLIDPWLSGPQSDVASWFSTQWHVIQPSVKTIAELEVRLQDIEELAQQILPRDKHSLKPGDCTYTRPSFIDAVAVCHEFSDHCHQATLVDIHPSVPVIATDKAADLIRSWNHFKAVFTTPSFSAVHPDWRKTSIDCLPDWVGISRVVTAGNALYYHSALLIAFSSREEKEASADAADAAEAIIYTPHGIASNDVKHIPEAVPPLKTLALLHGLHDIALTKSFQLNLGAHNGLKVQRITQPRYWVANHDEVKTGGGIVSYFLRRSVITIKDALAQENTEMRDIMDTKKENGIENVNFAELQSGESLLLE